MCPRRGAEKTRKRKKMDGCRARGTAAFLSLLSSHGIVSLSPFTPPQCTTPDDMSIAERFLDEAAAAAAKAVSAGAA